MSTEITKAGNHAKNDECVLVPATDIFETENEFSLKFDMPGVTKENLEVTLQNDELEIKGNVEKYAPENLELKYSEYTSSNYYRKFKISNDINQKGINATLENGVLSLVLQKNEEVKPKKIKINVTH